jgi:hypothetical protein
MPDDQIKNTINAMELWEQLSKSWRLIPLKGKEAFEAGWQKPHVKKPEFDAKRFNDKNAGIPTGPENGLLVVDVDNHSIFKEHCQKSGWFVTSTFTVKTSGGYHLYYQYPKDTLIRYRNKAKKKLGYDIRGLGGYVVCPGSVHPDSGKPYEIVEDVPIAPPPPWLTDIYKTPTPPAKTLKIEKPKAFWNGDPEALPVSDDILSLINKGRPKGERSEPMMSVLNALVGADVPDEDIYAIFETQPIGEKYREKGKGRQNWLQPQIEKARDWCSGHASIKSDEHPKPIDIFGERTLAGRPDLPKNSCPALIEDFAYDSAERLGVEPGIVAMPSIVVCASVIDDGFQIQPKVYDTGWKESARLWYANIAKSSDKKTPALLIAKKPLGTLEIDLYHSDLPLQEKYELEKAKYDSLKKKGKVKGLEKPGRPKQRRRVSDDITVERLRDILKDNPQGILIFRDELSGWIGSFDAYKQTGRAGSDRAAYLEAYNGGPRFIDRVGKGRVLVPNWSISIIGGIQRSSMRRLFGTITDDGLLQRFILVHSDDAADGVDRPPDYDVMEAYEKLISRLSNLKPKTDAADFKYSPEAQRQRQIVSKVIKNVKILPDTSPSFKSHLSKLDGIYPRLCLTHHFIESVANGEPYPSPWISESTAAKAARLMIDYILPNIACFYQETLDNDAHFEHSRWIAGYVLARKLDKITLSNIGRAYRALRGKKYEIERALGALELAGWVYISRYHKNGRAKWWNVNPQVHSIYANRAKEERQRRKEELEKIQQAAKSLGIDHG